MKKKLFKNIKELFGYKPKEKVDQPTNQTKIPSDPMYDGLNGWRESTIGRIDNNGKPIKYDGACYTGDDPTADAIRAYLAYEQAKAEEAQKKLDIKGVLGL